MQEDLVLGSGDALPLAGATKEPVNIVCCGLGSIMKELKKVLGVLVEGSFGGCEYWLSC